MPFTPFHMGPGCAIKAVLGRSFSLTVFGFAQVAMDLEPLIRILRGDKILHGVSHTYVGATFIALVSLFVGRPVCQVLLRLWPMEDDAGLLDWLRGPRAISWTAALTGAFIGTYSHVFLDSIMHADLEPFWPFSASNDLLHLLGIPELHLLCVAAGLVGGVCLVAEYWLLGRHRKNKESLS